MEGIVLSNPVILEPKKKGRPKKKQLVENLLPDNWDVHQMNSAEITNILNLDSVNTSNSQLFIEVEKDEVKLSEKGEPEVDVSKILEIREAQSIDYGHTNDATEPLPKNETSVIVNEVETTEDIKGFDAQSFTGNKEETTEQFMGQYHEVKLAAEDLKSVAIETEAMITVDGYNGFEPPRKRGKPRKEKITAIENLSEPKETFILNDSGHLLTSRSRKKVITVQNFKVVKKRRGRPAKSNEGSNGKVGKDGNGNSEDCLVFNKSEVVKKRRGRKKGDGHEQSEKLSVKTALKGEKNALDEKVLSLGEQKFFVQDDVMATGMKKSKPSTSAKSFIGKQKKDLQQKQKRGDNVQKRRVSGWKAENNEIVMTESVMDGLYFEKQRKGRKRSGVDLNENTKTSKPRPGRKRKIADTVAESEYATGITKKSTKFGFKKAQSNRLATAAVPQKFVGAHVSMAGGIYNAIYNAASMGAKSFALFLKSSRTWQSSPLDDGDALKFREACKEYGYPSHLILPHGSYLMNCGSPHRETLEKSRDALIDELQRCEKLGLTLYNFHPGSTCGKGTVEDCLDRIAQSINIAHSQTKYVTTVIENMSCQGSTIGGKFTELAGIIARVKDKSRIGVCLDTCHAYAAGYDLSTEAGYNQMIGDFDRIIGFQYLKALHLNDSAGKLGCHLDRHENIGKGNIGKEGFRRVMNEPRFDNIPMILETPYTSDEIYSSEINLLESLCSK